MTSSNGLSLRIVPPNRPEFSVTLIDRGTPYTFGRRTRGTQKADIAISDRRLAGLHCRLQILSPGEWQIEKLDKNADIFVDQKAVEGTTLLDDASTIKIGSTQIYVETVAVDDAMKTTRGDLVFGDDDDDEATVMISASSSGSLADVEATQILGSDSASGESSSHEDDDDEATVMISASSSGSSADVEATQFLGSDSVSGESSSHEDDDDEATVMISASSSGSSADVEATQFLGSDSVSGESSSSDEATEILSPALVDGVEEAEATRLMDVTEAASDPDATEMLSSESQENSDGNSNKVQSPDEETIPSGKVAIAAFLTITPKGNEPYSVKLDNSETEIIIGRGQQGQKSRNDIAIPDQYISFRHCKLERQDDGIWILTDLMSTNGTIVQGITLDRPLKLEDATEILIGTTRLSFNLIFGMAEPNPAISNEDNDATHLLDQNTQIDPKVSDAGSDADDRMDETVVADDINRQMDTETSHSVTEQLTARPDGDDEDTFLDGTALAENFGDEEPSSSKQGPAVQAVSDDESDPTEIHNVEARVRPKGQLQDGASCGPITAKELEESQAQGSDGSFAENIVIKGIAEELIEQNLLDIQRARMVVESARQKGMTFFRALVSEETIRLKDEIYEYVAESRNLALIRNEIELRDQVYLPDWLPDSVAEARGILTLLPDGDAQSRYVTIDPFDIRNADMLNERLEEEALKLLILPEAFQRTIHRYKSQRDTDESEEIVISVDISEAEANIIESNITSSNVPEMVDYLLYRGHRQDASDIHVEPMEELLAIRNRVDGILHQDTTLPLAVHPEIVSRIKILSGMDVAEKRRPQDGRIAAEIQRAPIDVRVSTYPTVYGEKIVMRLLDKNALRPSPDTLGLLPKELQVLKDKINAPFGLIMISGPTGSGKTTTLYSCLGSIDKNAKNVLTVEDPVEYRLSGVHQLQVNEKIGLTFASGLRTILRQDPDVIMVGECRDPETAAMAIQAALTGHIVFSTIHTNDAIGVITRLIDIGVDPFLVANSLSLAVAQRLIRRICPHCKTSVEGSTIIQQLADDGVSKERLDSLGILIDEDMFYATGEGCMHCHGTGYLGRQAVFEMFEMTGEARSLILSPNFEADKLRAIADETGMASLIEHGLQLVDEAVTTHGEVMRVLGEKY